MNIDFIKKNLPVPMIEFLEGIDEGISNHYPKPDSLNEDNCKDMIEEAIKRIPKKPNFIKETGIVMCAGGKTYLTNAYINIRNLRDLGVDWPIQIWHKNQAEILGNFKDLVKDLNVEFVDTSLLKSIIPSRILNGWELKVYAIKWCPFDLVLSLDADSFAVKNPNFIFGTKEFLDTGAIFFPDQSTFHPEHKMWKLIDAKYKKEREFEAGQIFLNKDKCWGPICLTMWMNEYSDFFYKHVHGDKETFHFSWIKMNAPYFMGQPYKLIGFHHWQHWYDDLLFQHRTWSKYSLDQEVVIGDMRRIDKHLSYMEDLRKFWKL